MSEADHKPKKSIFWQPDAERDARDRVVMQAHEQATARGEKRQLLRTVTGELYSYQKEEIGFVTGGSGAKITTGTGMLVVGILMCIATVAAGVFTVLEQGPTTGERAGLYFMTAFFAAIAWYFMHLGLAEHRARKLRKARGLPKPLLGALLRLP